MGLYTAGGRRNTNHKDATNGIRPTKMGYGFAPMYAPHRRQRRVKAPVERLRNGPIAGMKGVSKPGINPVPTNAVGTTHAIQQYGIVV